MPPGDGDGTGLPGWAGQMTARRGVTVLALMASVVLGACEGQASSDRREPPAGRAISPAGGRAMADAQAAFARCMRAQGVDFPDPRPGGGGFELDPVSNPGLERRIEEAEAGCEAERRAIAAAAPRLSARDRRRELEIGLRYARCMREQGQQVPDPRASDESGGTAIAVPPDAKTDPDFQRASRRCEHILRESQAGAP